MNIRDYIHINQIPTGDTMEFNTKVLEYFTVNTQDMTVKEVSKKVKELTSIKANEIKTNKIKVDGEWYMIDKDITKSTFGQFIELESYLSDETYLINHLNEVLAIYVRPRVKSITGFKIQKWDPEKKDDISNKLLLMDINDAFGLNVFFYHNAQDSIKNIKTFYLQQMMKELKQMMK